MTRMGNVAGYRQAFADAQEYREQWRKYEREVGEYQKEGRRERRTRKTPRKRTHRPPRPSAISSWKRWSAR